MKLILTGRSKTTTPLKSMESNTGQTLSLKKEVYYSLIGHVIRPIVTTILKRFKNESSINFFLKYYKNSLILFLR